MKDIDLKLFDHKICRSCGQIFYGENNVCDECLDNFSTIGIELKSSKYIEYLKYCKYCGRPFINGMIVERKGKKFFQPNRGTYCKGIDGKGKHFSQCQNCGNSIQLKDLSGGWPNKLGCSRRCTAEIKHRSQIKTSLERYGVAYPNECDEIQQKRKQTCLQRYGVECVLCTGPIRDKIDASMKKKFSVESNISQNPEIRKKITQTVNQRYGGYTWKSKELSQKCKQTSLDRYGTEYPHQSEIIQKKIHDGLIRNYANSIKDLDMRDNYLSFIKDPINYIKGHFNDKPTIHDVSKSIGNLDESSIYSYVGSGKSKELFQYVYSNMENEIFEFICNLGEFNIQRNNREIISPKELDLYLPEFKLGIECNPTSSHNSSIYYILPDNILSPNYHQNKTNLCQNQNIFLFHIFGYEWSWKRDIIKSMIRNILGKCEIKFYARKLYVEEISFYECKSFLNMNHRQGFANAKVRLGLKTEDNILVSVMTFDRTRHTIGGKDSDTENTWELVRFCNLLNTSVVGGASKLFKYFLNHYEYDKIISFSDRAHTKGDLYQTLGFSQVHISEPNYVWVNYTDDTYYNRVTCQKRNLPKLFDEPDLDIENQTEKQIMVSHGFVQVFDSGNIRWEYTNTSV